MNLSPWNMLFHAINALLLIFAYKRFLYKPVREYLNARANKLKAEREEIENARISAMDQEKQARYEMDNARVQATKTLQDSHSRSELEAAEVIKQAQAEASRIIEEAQKRAEDMIARSHEEVRAEAMEIALLMAEKVLVREVSKTDNKKIIDQFLTEMSSK